MKEKYNKYPIIFSTIPIERMWGGNLIHNYLSKENVSNNSRVKYGELWLLSDRIEAQSIATNGIYKGLTLNYLWNNFGNDIFGKNAKATEFPILIKIIDAGEDLSLQVHPRKTDLKYLPNAQSKTEMWVVLNHKPQAKIWAGFNSLDNSFSKEKFKRILNSPLELKKLIREYFCETGSYYYIPSGTIHAIGKGNLIFEIQENSDTTYRVSDWGRVDREGISRKLHVEESLHCINFTTTEIYKGKISNFTNHKNLIEQQLSPKNKFFNLNYWNINNTIIYATNPSYQFLTLIEGELEIICNETSYIIPLFTSVLLPLSGSYILNPLTNRVSLLTYNNYNIN